MTQELIAAIYRPYCTVLSGIKSYCLNYKDRYNVWFI